MSKVYINNDESFSEASNINVLINDEWKNATIHVIGKNGDYGGAGTKGELTSPQGSVFYHNSMDTESELEDTWDWHSEVLNNVDSISSPAWKTSCAQILWDEDHGHFGCGFKKYLGDATEAWIQNYLYYPSSNEEASRYWDWEVDGDADAGTAKWGIGWGGTYDNDGYGGDSQSGAWSSRVGASKIESDEDNKWGDGPHLGDSTYVGLKYYVYYQSKGGESQSGNYGDPFYWGHQDRDNGHRIGVIEHDTWYRIDQYCKINSGTNEDGVLTAWINGKLAFDERDWQFIDRNEHPNRGIKETWFNCYMGGSETIPKDMYTFYDELRVSLDGALAEDSMLEEPNQGYPWL